MTDLEITRLCAEAMGWKQCGERSDFETVKAMPVTQFHGATPYQYAPLSSSAAAFDLANIFKLRITWHFASNCVRFTP